MAPISRPNDWSKTLTEVAEQGKFTPTAQRQLAFWTEFRSYLQQHSTRFRPGKASPKHYMDFRPFKSGAAQLSAVLNMKDGYVRIELGLWSSYAKAHFAALEQHRGEIECALGPLDWRPLPNKKHSTIELRNTAVNPNDEAQWPAACAWMCQQLDAFYYVFAPLIKALPAATGFSASIEDKSADEDEE